jgi:hypothetical protein
MSGKSGNIRMEASKSHLAVGGALSSEEFAALNSEAPSADQILGGLDQLADSFADDLQTKDWSPSATAQTEESEHEVPVPMRPTLKLPKQVKRPVSSASARPTAPPKALVSRAKRKEQAAAVQEAPVSDLGLELDALEAELAEQASVEEVQLAPSMHSQILEILTSTPGAPGQPQIDAWKRQYGANAVHCIAFGEGDVYIFTHLKRGQWQQIQQMTEQIAQQGGNQVVQDKMTEKIVQHAMIWPRLPIEFFINSRAGVVPSLYEVIMLNSYFLNAQQAMLLTTQL